MSTLNTFGFNVRRKRNHDTYTPLPSKQEKTSSAPTLAFAASSPLSLCQTSKPQIGSPINKNNTKSKSNKQQLPKDPKQSTLLPFFTTTQPTISSQAAPATSLPTNTYATVTQSHSSLQTALPSQITIQEQQANNDENELCVVRRHVSMNELLPMLMDAFGEYSNDDLFERMQYGKQQNTILLQVKTCKTMRSIQSVAMDYTIENDLVSTQRRRRRRSSLEMSEDDDDDLATETLRTAFTNSLSLVSVKKRLCGKPSTKLLARQHRMASALFENGQERHMYTLEDEFGKQQRQQQEDNEIHTVRKCLSPGQVNSLLLDIANEYLAFENNTWCASYIGL